MELYGGESVETILALLEVRNPPDHKAGYTAAEVARGWTGVTIELAYPNIWPGAVMQNLPFTPKKLTRTDQVT